MTRTQLHILAGLGLALLPGLAHAGDDHPHRSITISGQCHSCDLARENLYGAEIIGASLIEANLDDTNLNHAVIVESRFISASLMRTDFTTARLSGVMFQESDMEGAIFTHVHGERLRFDGSELEGADLSHALMILANFMETDLTGARFTATRLFNSRFDGATLDETDFTAVSMPGVLLRGAEGRGAKFVGADLRGADLTGAHFIRADFTGASLQGARLDGTVLIEAEGLTAETLRDACRTASSQLPEGFDLIDCHDRPREGQARIERPAFRVWVTTNGSDETVRFLPHGTETMRVEEIRERQRRAVAEFEIMQDALAESRRAVIEAERRLRDARIDRERSEEIAAEIEDALREVEEIESELREQEAELIEEAEADPEWTGRERRAGERLVFSDYPGVRHPDDPPPAVIVDGARFRLDGRYEWVMDRIPAGALGPKGPGAAELPPPPEPVDND